jgi:carbonic anhydrase
VSPTQRTLALLRKEGYYATVVEHWNAFTKRRGDLFGIIDVLAVGRDSTVAVQTTSDSNVSARVNKLSESEALPKLREAGWVVLVHGWKQDTKTKRWQCRIVDLS